MNRFRLMLPPGFGVAESLAEVLGVSLDSAYRRLRGETELTLDEIYAVSKKYPFSIDELFGGKSDKVTFGYLKLTDSAKNFHQYLERILAHLKMLNSFPNRKMYYVAEEMPLFYSFHSPLFTDFKLFYWQRSVLNCPEYQQAQYEPGIVPRELVDIANQSYSEYRTVPSVEVWTDLTVLTGLRQIGYYFDSGVIDKQMALKLLTEYRKTIEVVQGFAEDGRKSAGDQAETFQMYSSELVLGTNCIYTMAGEAAFAYISFNTLNSLSTTNPEFVQETSFWMRNLERRSTLISGTSEKHRYQFFTSMYRKIDEQIARVQHA
jgi:hypothetical protein